MQRVSSYEIKQKFGEALKIIRREPIMIRRYNRDAAVMMSRKDFAEFTRLRDQEYRSHVERLLDTLETAPIDEASRPIQTLFAVLLTALGESERLRVPPAPADEPGAPEPL